MQPPVEQLIPGNRPLVSPGLAASSPMACVASQTQAISPTFTPLALVEAHVTVECHIATAFVVIEFDVDASSTYGGPGYLIVPKNYDATVTEVKIDNLTRDSVYATMVVPKEEAGKYAARSGNPVNPGAVPAGSLDPNDPELFLMNFGEVKKSDKFRITLHMFQPMVFQVEQGYYSLQLPLEWPRQMLRNPQDLHNKMTVDCAINTGVPAEVRWRAPTHNMTPTENIPGRVLLTSDSETKFDNADFMVGYQVWGSAIVASVNVQAPVLKAQDPRGTFSLSISPPAPEATEVWHQ